MNKVQGLVLFSCVGQLLDRKCKARQDWFYGRRIVDWMLCQCRARLICSCAFVDKGFFFEFGQSNIQMQVARYDLEIVLESARRGLENE